MTAPKKALCPKTGVECHYLSCKRGTCARTIKLPAPFKRASKLEPSQSKTQPKRGKK